MAKNCIQAFRCGYDIEQYFNLPTIYLPNQATLTS